MLSGCAAPSPPPVKKNMLLICVFCLVVVLLKVVVNTFKSCRYFGDTKYYLLTVNMLVGCWPGESLRAVLLRESLCTFDEGWCYSDTTLNIVNHTPVGFNLNSSSLLQNLIQLPWW